MPRLTDYVVAFNSDESSGTKNVGIMEESSGFLKKDIEVRIKVPRICYV